MTRLAEICAAAVALVVRPRKRKRGTRRRTSIPRTVSEGCGSNHREQE